MGDGGVVYIVLLPPWAFVGICGPPMVGMSFYWTLWPTDNSLMMVMMMTMVTQHIPTMTKSHHGGEMSVMIIDMIIDIVIIIIMIIHLGHVSFSDSR